MLSRLLLGSALLVLSMFAVGCGWSRHETRPSGYPPCCGSQPNPCDPCAQPAPAPSYYAPPPPCGR